MGLYLQQVLYSNKAKHICAISIVEQQPQKLLCIGTMKSPARLLFAIFDKTISQPNSLLSFFFTSEHHPTTISGHHHKFPFISEMEKPITQNNKFYDNIFGNIMRELQKQDQQIIYSFFFFAFGWILQSYYMVMVMQFQYSGATNSFIYNSTYMQSIYQSFRIYYNTYTYTIYMLCMVYMDFRRTIKCGNRFQ